MVVKNKFIFYDKTTAIIEDYAFYADNEQAIDKWLEDHNCERQGMVIKFVNEKIKMMFILRWA